MYQRGALMLHASAVKTQEGAVAFCARRGAGKSTLAAMLSTLGYALVSDDLCRVHTSREEPPRLYPSVPRFKLCEDAVARLGWNADSSHPGEMQAGKYHFQRSSPEADRDLPLKRIYLLSWGAPDIHRLRGFGALTRLTSASTWRGDLLIVTGDPAGQFAKCADLLRHVECWEFRRPRDLDLLAGSAEQLIRHMSDFGTLIDVQRLGTVPGITICRFIMMELSPPLC